MDVADNSTLTRIGGLVYGSLLDVAVFTLVYGAFLVTTFLSWLLLWSKRADRPLHRMRLLWFSVIIFILTTVLWCGQISTRARQIQITLVGDASQSLQDRLAQVGLLTSVSLLNIWIASINMLYADAILLWRAWIISPNNRKWTSVAIFCWLCSLAAALVSNVSIVLSRAILVPNPTYTSAATAALAASFLTNVAATSIIAVTVFQYRRRLANATGWSTPASKVGLLFVESGFFYSFFQLVVLIFNVLSGYTRRVIGTDTRVASSILYQSLSYVAALYPTLVIIIVHVNKSFLDTTIPDQIVPDNSIHRVSSSSVVFASRKDCAPAIDGAMGVPLTPLTLNNNEDLSSGTSKGHMFGSRSYHPYE